MQAEGRLHCTVPCSRGPPWSPQDQSDLQVTEYSLRRRFYIATREKIRVGFFDSLYVTSSSSRVIFIWKKPKAGSAGWYAASDWTTSPPTSSNFPGTFPLFPLTKSILTILKTLSLQQDNQHSQYPTRLRLLPCALCTDPDLTAEESESPPGVSFLGPR